MSDTYGALALFAAAGILVMAWALRGIRRDIARSNRFLDAIDAALNAPDPIDVANEYHYDGDPVLDALEVRRGENLDDAIDLELWACELEEDA